MHHLDEEGAASAPGEGKTQANEAGDVKGLFAVVPPLGVKKLTQHPADNKFQDGADDDCADEGEKPAVMEGFHKHNEHEHAGAIDGADWSGEHAAVDEVAGYEGVVGDFYAPTEKRVDVKKREQMQQRFISTHGDTVLFLNSFLLYIQVVMLARMPAEEWRGNLYKHKQ